LIGFLGDRLGIQGVWGYFGSRQCANSLNLGDIPECGEVAMDYRIPITKKKFSAKKFDRLKIGSPSIYCELNLDIFRDALILLTL
jgi:hypothetical protein